VEAGIPVLPVNPELVSRRRGPARKKDDAEDARDLLPARPGPARRAPAADPARADRRGAAVHRPRRRAGLPRRTAAAQPAARRPDRHLPPPRWAIAGEDLGATRILRLLERWPTAAGLAAASREEIIEFGPRAAHRLPAALRRPDRRSARRRPTSPHQSTWPGPRSTRSGSPPASCCSSTRSGGPGRNGWRSSMLGTPRPAAGGPAGASVFLAARPT